MLVSTQRSFSGCYFVFDGLSLVADHINKTIKALMSLFSPEDTTENGDQKQLQAARFENGNTRGVTKALFWIIISIIIGLLIGQLN